MPFHAFEIKLYNRASYRTLLKKDEKWEKKKYFNSTDLGDFVQSGSPDIFSDVIFEQSIANKNVYVCIKVGKEMREDLQKWKYGMILFIVKTEDDNYYFEDKEEATKFVSKLDNKKDCEIRAILAFEHCPECGGFLYDYGAGCYVCRDCGYTKTVSL